MLKGDNPGKLDRRITLQNRTVAANAFNESIETWSDLDTVWANVEYSLTGSGEGFEDAVNLAQTRVDFTIRHRSDVGHVERISYNSETYDIESPLAEIGRRQYLKIRAKLRK